VRGLKKQTKKIKKNSCMSQLGKKKVLEAKLMIDMAKVNFITKKFQPKIIIFQFCEIKKFMKIST
jgi:hypothetical protein